MNTPKIKYAEALPGYRLFLIFEEGSIRLYDLSEKIKEEIYAPLQDETFFAEVKTDAGGYGLSWNDDIDLSENECWQNSREISRISELTGI